MHVVVGDSMVETVPCKLPRAVQLFDKASCCRCCFASGCTAQIAAQLAVRDAGNKT